MRHLFMHLLIGTATAFALPYAALAKANPDIFALEDGIRVSADSEQRIDIASMSVDMKLHGRIAETVIEFTLANPSDDEVEANFALDLPADAVVTGYALDIDGVMIDGALVDQPKAKAVYEDEIRKGIDPGLAEVTLGNVFRTRVYPVNAEGQRKIRVRFIAPADAANGFALPFESEGPVGSFTVNIEADGFRDMPAVQMPFDGTLALKRHGNRWSGSANAPKGSKLAGQLRIAGGQTVDDMLISQHVNGRSFFQISGGSLSRNAQPVPIERVRIYWDSSLSRRDDLLDAEFALVADVVAKAGSPAIDIVRFSAAEPELLNPASLQAAIDTLKATTYRGGTSFRGLDNLKLPDADLCILFSDGAPTIQTDAEFRPDCRLMVVSSAIEASSLRLGMIARQSHGQFLRLTADNSTKLADLITNPAVAVVAARDESGRKLSFRTLAASDGGWFVVGRAPDNGDVQLTISGLGKGKGRKIYSQNANAFAKSNGAGVLWAAEELARLADNPLKREDMRDMAESYDVASPTMSLIVLERPDQYLDADIKPPKGFNEEWMANYRERKKARDKNLAEAKAERFEDVRERWAERKTWWSKVFNPPKRVKKQRGDDEIADTADAAAEMPPSPAPAYAQSASLDVAEEAAEDESSGEYIVVTSSRRSDTVNQQVALSVNMVAGVDNDGNPVKVEIADVLSDQPYLKALDAAAPEMRLKVFAEQEKIFGTLPAFYLDTAEWFRLKGDAALSDTLMLSALELPVADDETRSIVAFRLQRAGAFDEAVRILELIEVRTDNRPQPRRSLAQALIARGKARGTAGLADLERAFKLLVSVALDPGKDGYSGGDFEGIETVALMEANALIPLIEQYGGSWELNRDLTGTLDTDVRIVIEWTNDDADIDLWVIEPTGEKTFYENQESEAGGAITNDMTDGYGPEEYVIRRAVPGEYVVKINGYSPDRLNPNGKGRVMVRLIRDFARKNESEELIDAELSFQDNGQQTRSTDSAKLVAKLKVDKKHR